MASLRTSSTCSVLIDVRLPGCPQNILVACCDLLYALTCWTEDIFEPSSCSPLPKGGIGALLGASRCHKMQQIWTAVLCASPTLSHRALGNARSDFVEIVENALSTISC